MFCCKGREKRDHSEPQPSKKEMVERYILRSCKPSQDVSVDESSDHTRLRIIDYDEQNYEKIAWSPTQWQMFIQTKTVQKVDKDELRKNLRAGILRSLKPATWFWLSDIQNKQIRIHSHDIYIKLKSYQSYQDNQIFKDIKSLDKMYSNQIFDIARAYANYDVEFGYCQGMHLVIEYVARELNPEQYANLDYSYNNYNRNDDFFDLSVFWLCVHLFIELGLRKSFKSGLAFVDNEKFDNTLMPSIKDSLSRFNKPLNQLISQPLILAFKKCFKSEDFNRIFDVYMLEGEPFLQQVLLKLLKLSENIILMFQTECDLQIYLNQTMIPYGVGQLDKYQRDNYMNLLLM